MIKREDWNLSSSKLFLFRPCFSNELISIKFALRKGLKASRPRIFPRIFTRIFLLKILGEALRWITSISHFCYIAIPQWIIKGWRGYVFIVFRPRTDRMLNLCFVSTMFSTPPSTLLGKLNIWNIIFFRSVIYAQKRLLVYLSFSFLKRTYSWQNCERKNIQDCFIIHDYYVYEYF